MVGAGVRLLEAEHHVGWRAGGLPSLGDAGLQAEMKAPLPAPPVALPLPSSVDQQALAAFHEILDGLPLPFQLDRCNFSLVPSDCPWN